MSDDEDVDGWAVLLVPFSLIDGTDGTGKPRITGEFHLRRAVGMAGANAAEQKTFYRSLLKMPWLPPALCRAVMAELGLSLRTRNRDREEGGTIAMLHMINERREAMRAQRLRPRGGTHEAAVAEIARRQGMTVDALKKRLQRYKRRQRS